MVNSLNKSNKSIQFTLETQMNYANNFFDRTLTLYLTINFVLLSIEH